MKTSSDDLFTLIKALDTREKGFFKVFSIKKSFNKNSMSYLKLFDVIDKLKTYDESLLIVKLKKIGFEHHLQKAKTYLTKAIHDSLKEYHSDISPDAELQELLHLTDIFIKKKLPKLAKKTLDKAEKLASENEMYEYLFVINSLKPSVLRLTKNIKDMEYYLHHGVIQEKRYFECLKNRIEFRNLVLETGLVRAKNDLAAKEKGLAKINSILKSPLLASPDKAHSFSSREDYYFIYHSCSLLLNKYDDATYVRQKEWVTYLELDKQKLGERVNSYLSALMALMLIQIKLGKTDEAEKQHEKIKYFYFSLPPKKELKTYYMNLLAPLSTIWECIL